VAQIRFGRKAILSGISASGHARSAERRRFVMPFTRSLHALVAVAAVTLAFASPARAQQNLPLGLTCGLSYFDDHEDMILIQPCNGTLTIEFIPTGPQGTHGQPGYYAYQAAPNFGNVFIGDFGGDGGGYFEQELQQNGVGYGGDSTHFVLPQGAVCGFHHTAYSPGHTCMGYNPAGTFGIGEDPLGVAGCPSGWHAERAFDMGSGNHYWVWCTYDDPNALSRSSSPLTVNGVACGMSHNDVNTQGPVGLCQGYNVRATTGSANCPGMISSQWIDMNEPEGIGLGYCTVNAPMPGYYTPNCTPRTCPKGSHWDSSDCQCECTLC
jgi:hypothetical protein